MRRDPEARNFFFVSQGELITITFTASNVPDTPLGDKQRVHAAESGNVLTMTVDTGARTAQCSFKATKPIGKSHIVIYECVFFKTTDPLSAKYVTFVEGKIQGQSTGPFKDGAATQIVRSGELWFTVE